MEVILMKIQDVIDLTGVTKRTLHHYDEIGLLSPVKNKQSGYRDYSDEDLNRLQAILFYKTLGFTLDEIRDVLNEDRDRLTTLEKQKQALLKKQAQLNQMIKTLDQTIQYEKEGKPMSNEEKFKGFDFNNTAYEEKATQLYGKEAVTTANANLNKGQVSQEEMHNTFKQLASLRHLPPTSEEAQTGIKVWVDQLKRVYPYTKDMLIGVAELYTMDERFTENIDQYGDGLAEFMQAAMIHYAKHQL
jgi:DNA-binding transcriptional MerR regulator